MSLLSSNILAICFTEDPVGISTSTVWVCFTSTGFNDLDT